MPKASRKRSKGNLESINSCEPPGIETVTSGIPEESESVVDRCAVYSCPSRSPAFCNNSSNCASPNFPRVCELDKAPAIFFVSSKIDSDARRISKIVVLSFASASVRMRLASLDWVVNFETDSLTANSSAFNLIADSVLVRSASSWAL